MFDGRSLPTSYESRQQIASSLSVYQTVSMLRGVVERGTARRVASVMEGRPVAGKTGTTNEARDAWFIGFTPDLAVGVYVGFDNPRPLGQGETGGRAASPIFAQFVSQALEGTEHVPFRVPDDVPRQYIDPVTGVIDVTQLVSDGLSIGLGDDGIPVELGPTAPDNNSSLGINASTRISGSSISSGSVGSGSGSGAGGGGSTSGGGSSGSIFSAGGSVSSDGIY